jgi:hypothetical protein
LVGAPSAVAGLRVEVEKRDDVGMRAVRAVGDTRECASADNALVGGIAVLVWERRGEGECIACFLWRA